GRYLRRRTSLHSTSHQVKLTSDLPSSREPVTIGPETRRRCKHAPVPIITKPSSPPAERAIRHHDMAATTHQPKIAQYRVLFSRRRRSNSCIGAKLAQTIQSSRIISKKV